MKKVLATDGMAPDGVAIFTAAKDVEINVRKGVTPKELLEIIPEYDGLIVRSATKVTPEVIAVASSLKVIGRAGVGVDNVAVDAASRRGIVVMNTPEANTISTAEHTVALLFSLARRTPEADATMKAGKWEKKALKGVELYGKTLGVIGYGRIGRWVATICDAVGMRVITYDPMVSAEKIRELGATPVPLEELFSRSDFITIHTPLNTATRHLIRAETIAQMKDGVCIINCARGGIVNEDDVCDAIDAGKIGGAAFDVFTEEPLKNERLRTYSQCVLTPHIAASTGEAQSKVGVEIAQQIVDFLTAGVISNAVNAPKMTSDQSELLMPFVRLGEKLGKLVAQLACGCVRELSITYEGSLGATSLDVNPITSAILCGVLAYNKEGVNCVNARLFAEESGLTVQETKSSAAKTYQNQIEIVATHECAQPVKVCAAVFGEDRSHPRIVRINGFHVDATPDDYLLIVEHKDAPGLIGTIGTLLGTCGINIARMTCDSLLLGETNVGVFSLEQPVCEDTRTALEEIPGVSKVYAIEL